MIAYDSYRQGAYSPPSTDPAKISAYVRIIKVKLRPVIKRKPYKIKYEAITLVM